eukprot:1153677-Pelagomonas_calceolata.AAC.6
MAVKKIWRPFTAMIRGLLLQRMRASKTGGQILQGLNFLQDADMSMQRLFAMTVGLVLLDIDLEVFYCNVVTPQRLEAFHCKVLLKAGNLLLRGLSTATLGHVLDWMVVFLMTAEALHRTDWAKTDQVLLRKAKAS